MYCLAATNDYSRFTWVFFLSTKDETSGILKSFVTRIENLVDHKAKVIRCNNGTEYKNKDMNQFYEMKGSGPNCLFDIDALTKTRNYQPVIVELKSSQDDGFKPSNDVGKKVNEVPRQQNECKDQEEKDSVNITNKVNNVSSTVNAASNEVNVVIKKSSIELLDDPNMPKLADISIFKDSNEDVFCIEADLNNLESTFQVSPILTTRIHKDHLLEQVIRDLHLAPQTRRMLKNLEEHGLVSTVNQRTNHKDLQN
nr:putative ribonuclease H-like domain-containing protein [Tanacetum cinerariifolium]